MCKKRKELFEKVCQKCSKELGKRYEKDSKNLDKKLCKKVAINKAKSIPNNSI